MGTTFPILWILTMAMALVLIENSMAFKCYSCSENDPDSICTPHSCPAHSSPEESRGMGTEFVCTAIYRGSKMGWKKGCASKKWYDRVLGGSDKCREFLADDYFTKSAKDYYKLMIEADPIAARKISEREFVEGMKESGTSEMSEGPGYDPNLKVKVCSCSKELCNDEEFDKRNMEMEVVYGPILKPSKHAHSRNSDL